MIIDKTETTNLSLLYPHLYEPMESEKFLKNNKKILSHRIHCIAARTLQVIAADYENRCNKCLNDPQLLNNGIWMANKYFSMLKSAGNTAEPRLKLLTDKNYIMDPLPPKGMEKIRVGIVDKPTATGYKLAEVALKAGVLPSEALTAARTGLALLDCRAACQIAYYQAIHDVIGKDKFNIIFRADGEDPLLFGGKKNPIDHFLKAADITPQTKDKRPVEVGSWIAFENIGQYIPKHNLLGDFQALNAICIDATPGQQKFVGLGVNGEGCSEDEIEQALVEAHNEAPFTTEFITDELMAKMAKMEDPSGFITGAKIRESQELRRNFLENPCKETEEKISAFYFPSGIKTEEEKQVVADVVETLSKMNKITLETARKEPFGYKSDTHFQLDIDLIQKIMQVPEKKLKQFWSRNRTQ